MEEKIIEGGDLMLFLDSKTLAFATSHKLSINVETVETSSKDAGSGKWKTSTARKISWSVSSENLFSEKGDSQKKQQAYDELFDLMVKRQAINAVMSRAKEADTADEIPASGWTEGSNKYEGKVIITSLEMNAPNGENATFSVSLEGTGELKHTSSLPA